MSNYWKDKTIFLTGGSGFLGRQVYNMLLKREAHVIAPGHTECDLLVPHFVQSWVNQWQPDMIIHMAALVGGIGINRSCPADFIRLNTLMNINVFEAARLANVSKLVTIGSTCAYPKICPRPFLESTLWMGLPEETNAPYGISKRHLLMMCMAYRQQYGLNAIHLIPTNMYGPHDNFDPVTSHVIPALIRKFDEADGQPVEVWGSGLASRDFLHVRDAARAILMAAEVYSRPEPINLGSGREVRIRELVEMLAHIYGHEAGITWLPEYPDGQPVRVLDITRARALLDWEPEIELEAGLREVIAWYQQHKS